MTTTSTDRTARIGDVGIKAPCVAASTGVLTLSGEQTVDGVSCITGDRVLVKNQTSSVDNGIYVCDTGTWSRAVDCDGSYDLTLGTLVKVNGGTANSGFWYAVGTNPLVVGSSAITWAQSSSTLAVISSWAQTLLDDTTQRLGQTTLGVKMVQPGETLTLQVRPSPGAGEYSTIQAAMDAAKSYRIMEAGKIQILVADGTYTLTAGVQFNHPDGQRLEVIGNETTPANVVIAVTYTGAFGFDCFYVTDGNILGKLNGFKFLKSSKAAVIDNTTAILANRNATIICGTKIVVDNWYYGIAARDNSYIYCPSASVDNAGDVGIWAYRNACVYAYGATSNNASDVPSNLGYGFQAEYGSFLNCSTGSATGCRKAGVGALSNGTVDAAACVSSTNTGSGFYANQSSTIYASGGTCNNNTRYGIEVYDNSLVSNPPVGANNTGNTIGQHSSANRKVTAITDTILDTDLSVTYNSTAIVTVTMPSPSGYIGRRIRLKTIAAFAVQNATAVILPQTSTAATTGMLAGTAGKWADFEVDETGGYWVTTASN